MSIGDADPLAFIEEEDDDENSPNTIKKQSSVGNLELDSHFIMMDKLKKFEQ